MIIMYLDLVRWSCTQWDFLSTQAFEHKVKLCHKCVILNASWLDNIPELRSGCNRTCNERSVWGKTRTTNYFNKITICLVHFWKPFPFLFRCQESITSRQTFPKCLLHFLPQPALETHSKMGCEAAISKLHPLNFGGKYSHLRHK